MSKVDKKRKRLDERITLLEDELRTSLTKKLSAGTEINVPLQMEKINVLRRQLAELK